MIDLHTHTNHSIDGTWSAEKLLEEAEKTGVTILAITDHDTVDAHLELKNKDISDIFSGRLIAGGEFNAMFNNAKIELLGYNFDIDMVNDWIKKTYIEDNYKPDLQQEFDMLVNACKKNGVEIEEGLKFTEKDEWPIDVVFASLKKFENNRQLFTEKEWDDIDHFFRCCTCNIDFPLYLDFSNQTPTAEEVSKAIRDAGGKVFLAHLFTYPLRDYEKYLHSLRENNIIDGVETYYSKFNEDQINFIENYCDKYNLFKSVGTDCHGSKKPDRKVGIGYGNMNYEEDVVSDWI